MASSMQIGTLLSVKKISALTSSLLFFLVLVLVVDDISSFKISSKAHGDAERPLYGIILNAPYPKPTYHNGQYQPYLPYRPVQHSSRPHPVAYPKPPASYFPTPSYYPVPPPVVPYQPVYNLPTVYQQPEHYRPAPVRPEPYRPPARPEPYRPPARPEPEPYRPPVRPAPYRPSPTHRPNYPIPTSFDNKPWSPIPTSATYVVDPSVQLNELDGYPWTPELRENDEKEEELKDKIPDILFKDDIPSKSLGQHHASANLISFSPNPERD